MRSPAVLMFVGLCAFAFLVYINVNETTEAIKEYQNDQFLNAIEQRVVARAQASLAKKSALRASKNHISSVREAIRKSLQSAKNTAMDDVEEDQLETMTEDAKAMGLITVKKTHKKVKQASKIKHPTKKFTWAQLQRGEDAPVGHNRRTAKASVQAKKKVGSLLQNLKQSTRVQKKAMRQKVVEKPVHKIDPMKAALQKAKAKAAAAPLAHTKVVQQHADDSESEHSLVHADAFDEEDHDEDDEDHDEDEEDDW